MKEKEILKETVSTSKPKELKKRNYKPRKKKEEKKEEVPFDMELVQRSGEIHSIIKPTQVGSYKIGKSFHIFFEIGRAHV